MLLLPIPCVLSGIIHVDAAGDDAFVDVRGVNSSTQSGRSASAHQEAEVGAEVSFLLSAVVCPSRFLWAEGDDGHPPSHSAIVPFKRPRAKIRSCHAREGIQCVAALGRVARASRGERLRDDEVGLQSHGVSNAGRSSSFLHSFFRH